MKLGYDMIRYDMGFSDMLCNDVCICIDVPEGIGIIQGVVRRRFRVTDFDFGY